MLVGFAEGLGAAKTYAERDHYEIDPNRELLGLGGADLAAGLSGGMVVNGSLSKTAVNAAAGPRTPAGRPPGRGADDPHPALPHRSLRRPAGGDAGRGWSDRPRWSTGRHRESAPALPRLLTATRRRLRHRRRVPTSSPRSPRCSASSSSTPCGTLHRHRGRPAPVALPRLAALRRRAGRAGRGGRSSATCASMRTRGGAPGHPSSSGSSRASSSPTPSRSGRGSRRRRSGGGGEGRRARPRVGPDASTSAPPACSAPSPTICGRTGVEVRLARVVGQVRDVLEHRPARPASALPDRRRRGRGTHAEPLSEYPNE